METLDEIERLIRRRFPEDRFMLAPVPAEERSDRRREEYVHFRASDVAWIETAGGRQLRLHLSDGRVVRFRGELGSALTFFAKMGYPFARTHRQVVARLDRVIGIEQA
jgi:DNA-binding LytR/AlgR family response regulator